jgi:ribosomal protein L40E
MFENVGEKIKSVALAFFWLGSIGCALFALATATEVGGFEGVLSFVIITALGVLISWLSSLTLYGFGELIESSAFTASKMQELSKKAERETSAPSVQSPTTPVSHFYSASKENVKFCKNCGAKNDKSSSKCRLCDSALC